MWGLCVKYCTIDNKRKRMKCCCRPRNQQADRASPSSRRMAEAGAASPGGRAVSPPPPEQTRRQGMTAIDSIKNLASNACRRWRRWAASIWSALGVMSVVQSMSAAFRAASCLQTNNVRMDERQNGERDPSIEQTADKEDSMDSSTMSNPNDQPEVKFRGSRDSNNNFKPAESERFRAGDRNSGLNGSNDSLKIAGRRRRFSTKRHDKRKCESDYYSSHASVRHKPPIAIWEPFRMFQQRHRQQASRFPRKLKEEVNNRRSLSLQESPRALQYEQPALMYEQQQQPENLNDKMDDGGIKSTGHRRRPSDFPVQLKMATSQDDVSGIQSCHKTSPEQTPTGTPPSPMGKTLQWMPMTIMLVSCILLTMTSATAQKSSLEASWGIESQSEQKVDYDFEAREIDPDKIDPRAFVAYDCNDIPSPTNESEVKMRAIDLTKVDECPNLETDYLPVEKRPVTLVQSNVPVRINVSRCHARISKFYTRHGWDSAIHSAKPFQTRTIDLGGDICVELRRQGQFSCPPSICGPGNRYSPMLKVTDGKATEYEWYLVGGHDQYYNSKDEKFNREENQAWVEKYGNIFAQMTLYTEMFEANLDIKTQRVWADELHFNGDYTHGGVFHRDFGTFGWTYEPKEECDHSLARIVEEPKAAVYQMKPSLRAGGGQFEFAGALVVIKNGTSNRASGLVVRAAADRCIPTCLETNIPDVTVCFSNESITAARQLPRIEDRPSTRINRLNMRGMGTFLDIQSKLGDAELHQQLAAEMCALDMKMLRSDFSSLVSGNQYALSALSITDPDRVVQGQTNSSVFSVSVRGSVAYLLECQPITVRPVGIPICTQQLPVALPNGKLGFVDAINLHLIGFPTPTECTKAMPVQFLIGGQRFCQSPGEIGPCPDGSEPTVLKPMVGRARGIKFSDLEAIGGLTFTEEQMNKLRKTRTAIEWGISSYSVIASKALEQSIDSSGQPISLHLGIPLSFKDIDFLTDKVKAAMFVLYGFFGQAVFHVITFTVLSVLFSHYCGCVARMYYLYKIRSCGCWMFPATVTSILSIVFLPVLILKGIMSTTKESLKEFRMGALPPPNYHRNVQMLNEHIDMLKDEIRQIRTTQIRIAENRMRGVEISPEQIKTLLYPAGHGRDVDDDDADNDRGVTRKKPTEEKGRGASTSDELGISAPIASFLALAAVGDPMLSQGATLMQHLPWLRTSSSAGSSSCSSSGPSQRHANATAGVDSRDK